MGLEEAAAKRCLVVGLLRLGLDGRLHLSLGPAMTFWHTDGVAPAARPTVL